MDMNDKKIVCIGGGTGLSTMLRGIKRYTNNLTAIVAVSDNGGSSGILRREMNMLPPGDIRNCLLALAETEPIMEKVLEYRFTEGSLKGQNIGNLFLAALNGIFGSFELAVEKANEVLAVKGTVLPVTTENVELCAIHDDGSITIGESEIVIESKTYRKPIKRVYLKPENPKAYHKAIDAIGQADIIVLGPGSLYTSIIPNLLVDGMSESICRSTAKKVYVSNIMTQPGETDHYTLKDHLDTLNEYMGKDVIDYLIVNDQLIENEVIQLYEEDSANQVIIDVIGRENRKVVRRPLIKVNENDKYIRHDHDELAKTIVDLLADL